jgi:hypothetical protein
MAKPVIVDLRNIYRPSDMAALGFNYESIGRPATSEANAEIAARQTSDKPPNQPSGVMYASRRGSDRLDAI